MLCLHAPNQGEIKARSHASGAVRRLLLPNRPLSVRLGSQIPSCNAGPSRSAEQLLTCSASTRQRPERASLQTGEIRAKPPQARQPCKRRTVRLGGRSDWPATVLCRLPHGADERASESASKRRMQPVLVAPLTPTHPGCSSGARRPCRDPTSHNPGARPAKGGIARSYRQTRSITHPGQCSISREPGVHIPARLLSERKTTSISARRRAAAQRLLRRAPGPRSWPRTLLPSRMRVQ